MGGKMNNNGYYNKSIGLLNRFTDFLNDIVYAIDLDCNIIAWNNEIERFSGKKAIDMLFTKFTGYDIIFNNGCETKPLSMQVLDESVTSKTMKVRCVYGKYYSFKAANIYDDNGEIIGVIESIRDMSEYMIMQKNYKLLYEATSFYLDNLPDLVWVVSYNDFIYKNKTLNDLLEIDNNLLDDNFFKVVDIENYIGKLKINNEYRYYDVRTLSIGETGHCYIARDITSEVENNIKMEEYIDNSIKNWNVKHIIDSRFIVDKIMDSKNILNKMGPVNEKEI